MHSSSYGQSSFYMCTRKLHQDENDNMAKSGVDFYQSANRHILYPRHLLGPLPAFLAC